MEHVLQTLKLYSTRSTTAHNYYRVWKLFNAFIIRLNRKPESWEGRLALYGAYLVEKGNQSSTLKSYFSAIKKVLEYIDYELNMNKVLLNTLTKACRIVNDKVKTRKPIQSATLEMLLFELERYFPSQVYLVALYKTAFVLAYYGMMRIGELTTSEHVMRAKDILIGVNKDKIKITLHSSKTHSQANKPQTIKISGINNHKCVTNQVKLKNRHFCPFKVVRRYMRLRNPSYANEKEQFPIFRDRSPVQPSHVREVLKELLKRIGLNPNEFGFHSFRIGRCTELFRMGCPIEIIMKLGRWRSNAVYRYIKD